MNKLVMFAAVTALLSLACTSCGPEPITPEDNTQKERVVIYSIEGYESKQEFETNAQWDNFLQKVCDYALEGKEIVFYNMCQTTYYEPSPQKSTSFTTSNRDEMIAWMKEKEKQGLTVVVTYNSDTGKWSGLAYVTSPAKSTAELLIGNWNFSSLTWIETDVNGVPQSNELYYPEDNFGDMIYTFSDNGLLTLTIHTTDGNTLSDEAEWTLSDNGELFSELLPNSTNWNINWITSNTLIISCNNPTDNEDYLSYQMKFEKQ